MELNSHISNLISKAKQIAEFHTDYSPAECTKVTLYLCQICRQYKMVKDKVQIPVHRFSFETKINLSNIQPVKKLDSFLYKKTNIKRKDNTSTKDFLIF